MIHKQVGGMTKFAELINGIPREDSVMGMRVIGEFEEEFHIAKLRMKAEQER
ncbi:MAG: hypothetical protein FWF46_09175 [Oscillospiraceae bacterium]|nr:hypothetical protein [Oscillospiraceae bacterium]